LLLAVTSAVILRSKSHWTHDHILLSQIRESPNLEGQIARFISARYRVARLYPQALDYLFVVPYYTQSKTITVIVVQSCKMLIVIVSERERQWIYVTLKKNDFLFDGIMKVNIIILETE
jgi:hypothetical protein